jgi:hypothetical protein
MGKTVMDDEQRIQVSKSLTKVGVLPLANM